MADPAPVLVIGIGSSLRTDDGAGRAVADAVAARGLPGVEVVSVHQLTPELAADLDGRRLVVFVDAAVEVGELRVERVEADGSGRLMTHHLGPAGLLALAAGLGWSVPDAVAVSIPAADLGLGTEVSAAIRPWVERAVAAVVELTGWG